MYNIKRAAIPVVLLLVLSCSSIINTDSREEFKRPVSKSGGNIVFIETVSPILSVEIVEAQKSIQIVKADSTSLAELWGELEETLKQLKISAVSAQKKEYTASGIGTFKDAPATLSGFQEQILIEIDRLGDSEPATSITLGDISKLIEFMDYTLGDINQTLDKVEWKSDAP